jgi:hypothetical protein
MPNSTPHSKTPAQPKFGALPPNAKSQFALDLLGVWAPKIPLSRSWSQVAEDAFLENIENGAFYFTIPLAAPLIGRGIAGLYNMLGKTPAAKQQLVNDIGTSWADLSKKAGVQAADKMEGYLAKVGETAGKQMLGAKAGTVIGVLALASGYEYMIQHAKNVMTAKGFGTKNFTAVAGLEDKRNQAVPGEQDPVKKAAARTWQVGSLMAGAFALAASVPAGVKNFKFAESAAKHLLSVCNFSSKDVGKQGKEVFFDITKPLLAFLTGVGAVSYIDAGRDHYERKETASRLALVIPYMLFGKELAGNTLAALVGRTRVTHNGKSQAINDIVLLSQGGFGDAFKQAAKKASFLDLDLTKGEEALKKELAGKPQALIDTIVKRNKFLVTWGRFGLGALVCGLGINWMSYHQTKQRYNKEHAQPKHLSPQAVPPMLGQVVHQSYGGFAAQGKPLEDSASRVAFPTPRVQAPLAGVRTSANPGYGYGQWRI